MQIAQLSDSHISLSHPQRMDDLKATIDGINAEKPDLVIHTGDIAHEGLVEEYNIARELLAELQAPLLPLVGNKDNRSRMINAFATNEYIQTDMPFVQYCVTDFPVTLVVLDTLHENSNKGQLCDKRMLDFEKMLAQNPDKPLAIFMHHPPFEAHEIPDPRQFDDWTEVQRFSDLIAGCENLIGIWCGHVHRNIDSNVGLVPASAITCLACDLRKGELTPLQRTEPVYKMIKLA